jgi:hypothetical protein
MDYIGQLTTRAKAEEMLALRWMAPDCDVEEINYLGVCSAFGVFIR